MIMRKYQIVAAAIRENIHQGLYATGSRLPRTNYLCDMYHVSIITIKRAMDELEADGLIVKRRGAGIFVKELNGQELEQLSRQDSADTAPTTSMNVLRFDVQHPQSDIADKLMISVNDFVYNISRSYPRSKETTVLESVEIPTMLLPGLREHCASNPLEKYIEQELNTKLQSSHCTVRAMMPTEQERQAAGFAEDLPVLELRQVKYLANGSPCMYSRSLICGEDATIHTVSLHPLL